MSTFLSLLGFELRDRLFRLSSLVYFFVYGALSFMLAITFAGAFHGATVDFGLSNKLALNSPLAIGNLTTLIGFMGFLITAPIFGQSINKDFENKFSQILFASPIRKPTYFFVRYLGSLLATTLILSSAAFGVWLATLMPFIDRSLVTENHAWYYLAPYLTTIIPNLLIFGAIFLAVVSYFRRMTPVYVASIIVFIGWLAAQSFTSDIENKTLAALLEPVGLAAIGQVVRYWSVAEQATRTVPLTGLFLMNRLIWGAIGLLFAVFAYAAFDPFRLANERKIPKADASSMAAPTVESAPAGGSLPIASLDPHSGVILWGLAKSEFRQAFSNVYFLMILLCGVLYVFGISGQIGKMFGTETLPVTYQVLEIVGGTFGLFILILTTFYAGELVWKDRDDHFYELVDSKPVPNLYLYLSKLFSLFFLQIALSLVVLVCSVLIQAFKGYFHFELGVYLQTLFLYGLPGKLLLCVLALFVQTVSRNKYVGHAVLILYYIAIGWLPSIGYDHLLYRVGTLPRAAYSDMNGFGTSFPKFATLGVYWGFFHAALAVITVLLWRRGVMQPAGTAFRELRRRLTPRSRALLVGSLVGWVAMGAFIFYNTNVLNHYETKATSERRQVDYEKTYKVYQRLSQPEIIGAKISADLFPETQSLRASGTLTYRNLTLEPITTVLLSQNRNWERLTYEWSRTATLTKDDVRLDTRTYTFNPPIAPGETLSVVFHHEFNPHGFRNEEFNKRVVQNGSFFNNTDFVPMVGYQSGGELAEEKTRRKYGLPERPRVPTTTDEWARQKSYISDEGSWIDFDAQVSTSPDQIAIAPGYLEKEWNENGRRYFHYKMDQPILNFYAFQSARYEVVHDQWNDVKIEVYHQPGHTTNIPRMINSAKKALDYYSKNFSPYQFRQFRIVEFPRYEIFAQSFPNTIPYSEAIGFIARVNAKDPESIDYPFYVTSHEMGHEWWAHQVIGAHMQGETMLSESLAQYSAMMVQEHEYGPKQMRKYLKFELDRYLQGRAHESKKELPLELNEDQGYIHYRKGSVIFYALKDYLGEDVVNHVLHDFVRDHAFRGAPFPRAHELTVKLREAAPANLKYLIEDFLETITFYDNRTDSVTYAKLPNGKFHVTVRGFSKKTRADDQGTEHEVPMNDQIDVGAFDKDANPLYLKKVAIHSGENVIQFDVDQAPYRGGIDPINKLIDKDSDDNLVRAKEAKSAE